MILEIVSSLNPVSRLRVSIVRFSPSNRETRKLSSGFSGRLRNTESNCGVLLRTAPDGILLLIRENSSLVLAAWIKYSAIGTEQKESYSISAEAKAPSKTGQ